jgi:hypothetical protein
MIAWDPDTGTQGTTHTQEELIIIQSYDDLPAIEYEGDNIILFGLIIIIKWHKDILHKLGVKRTARSPPGFSF